MGYLLSLAGTAGPVVVVLLAAYLVLIAVIALTAVYSQKPARRRAAVTVLRLLLPRRTPDGRPDPQESSAKPISSARYRLGADIRDHPGGGRPRRKTTAEQRSAPRVRLGYGPSQAASGPATGSTGTSSGPDVPAPTRTGRSGGRPW